jgi:hypothetical protein
MALALQVESGRKLRALVIRDKAGNRALGAVVPVILRLGGERCCLQRLTWSSTGLGEWLPSVGT